MDRIRLVTGLVALVGGAAVGMVQLVADPTGAVNGLDLWAAMLALWGVVFLAPLVHEHPDCPVCRGRGWERADGGLRLCRRCQGRGLRRG